MAAISKRTASKLDNKELMHRFRNIVMLSMIEANSRRGLTKTTEKSENIITEEMCNRLGFEYDPDDWNY